MKTKYILQMLPLLFLMIGLASCSEEEVISTDEPKEYNVSLNFKGEITTADLPLTRGTATNDLIGVQVYEDGTAFACGLFDNEEDININLLSRGKYKFVVTVVKNGKDKIKSSHDFYFYSYGLPLTYIVKGQGYQYKELDNKFVYSSNEYFYYLSGGTSELRGENKSTDYPDTDRFYGEIDNYTPTVNGTVAIDLKRTAFGLKYEVSGVTDGTVTVKIANTSRTFFENNAITADYQSSTKIFTFSDVYSAWLYADSYAESITVSASWARGVGITQDLGSKTVQIKRNANNIIRLKLGSDDKNGNIGIEVEEGDEMDEDIIAVTLKR